jgi:hypothetical protein
MLSRSARKRKRSQTASHVEDEYPVICIDTISSMCHHLFKVNNYEINVNLAEPIEP